MKKLLFVILIIFLISGWSGITSAQESDFGTWMSFDVSKEIVKHFDLEFEEEVRVFKNFSEINRFATTLGGAWSVNKHLKGGAGYTWIYRHDVNDSYWENRHRYYLYLTGRIDLGRFNFSLRERFQSSYRDKNAPGFDYNPENHLRSRLEAVWDLKGHPAEPYASAEMHYQLNNPDGNEIDNMRYTLGVDFPLSKRVNLDTYLRLDQDLNVKNPVKLFLVGLNLKWKL